MLKCNNFDVEVQILMKSYLFIKVIEMKKFRQFGEAKFEINIITYLECLIQ